MHFSSLFSYCPVCGSSSFNQNNSKSKHCENCGFVMYINPSAAVAVFIVNEKGELLVCKRGKDPEKGTLDLPGGFIDANESAEQAVSREIYEELQVNVVKTNYLFSLPNEYLYSGWTIPTMDIFYQCTLDNYTDLKPSDDVEDCFYIAINKLNPLEFGLQSIKKAIAIFKESRE